MRRCCPFRFHARAPASGPAVLALFVCLLIGSAGARATTLVPLPQAVAQMQSFRGRLAYLAHPQDDPRRTISGTLVVNGDGWLLEEQSGSSLLHASNDQSWLREGSKAVYFDDPLSVGALANPWAVLLGRSVGEAVTADRAGTSWAIGSRARVYIDTTLNQIAGVVDTASDADVSFSFAQWSNVDGLELPYSIVRMRGGAADASFIIDSYQVQWADKRDVGPQLGWRSIPIESAGSAVASEPAGALQKAWRSFGTLFGLLFAGLCLAAWVRRDALADRLSRRLVGDPRAWRDEGTSLFVSAEGVLWFEGRKYRVGAAFFNRPALVQSSPLFIRVSAAGVSRAVVLPRKLPLPTIVSSHSRRHVIGFTLIEALVATALFAAVIVGAVFPTLVVLAHADRVAAQHETARLIASNALVDEESALAYGSSIQHTSGTFGVEGMELTVIVSPSSIAGLHQITAQVSDPSGTLLARIATMVGPPVPAPQSSAAPPSR